MERYPVDRLYEEVAFVAYHFHWSREEVMSMPHRERQRWCEEISRINDRLNESANESRGTGPASGSPGPGPGPGPQGPGGGFDVHDGR